MQRLPRAMAMVLLALTTGACDRSSSAAAPSQEQITPQPPTAQAPSVPWPPAARTPPAIDPEIVKTPPAAVDPQAIERPPANVDPGMIARPPLDATPAVGTGGGVLPRKPGSARLQDCGGPAEACRQDSSR